MAAWACHSFLQGQDRGSGTGDMIFMPSIFKLLGDASVVLWYWTCTCWTTPCGNDFISISFFFIIKKRFFFDGSHFYSLYWICYNSAFVLWVFWATKHVGSQLSYQRWNQHSLHWKVKSQLLDFQGSPFISVSTVLSTVPDSWEPFRSHLLNEGRNSWKNNRLNLEGWILVSSGSPISVRPWLYQNLTYSHLITYELTNSYF